MTKEQLIRGIQKNDLLIEREKTHWVKRVKKEGVTLSLVKELSVLVNRRTRLSMQELGVLNKKKHPLLQDLFAKLVRESSIVRSLFQKQAAQFERDVSDVLEEVAQKSDQEQALEIKKGLSRAATQKKAARTKK